MLRSNHIFSRFLPVPRLKSYLTGVVAVSCFALITYLSRWIVQCLQIDNSLYFEIYLKLKNFRWPFLLSIYFSLYSFSLCFTFYLHSKARAGGFYYQSCQGVQFTNPIGS
jgi:hypothetical protein